MKKSFSAIIACAFVALIALTGCGATTVADPFYPTAADLAKTYDKQNKLSQQVHETVYAWYCGKEWKELEIYFNADTINSTYPPGNGGFDTKLVPLTKGQVFDRYQENFAGETGGIPTLYGYFTSPVENGKPFTYAQRALKAPEAANALYYRIELLQDLTFTGEEAVVIPWFAQPGMGKQTRIVAPVNPATKSPFTWNEMAEKGWMKITIISSPSGQYSIYDGLVITSQ